MTTKQQPIDCKTTVHSVPQRNPKNEPEHPTTARITSTIKPTTKKYKTKIETRQSRRLRQQQGLPLQPHAALNVFAGQRFLPQLPAIATNQETTNQQATNRSPLASPNGPGILRFNTGATSGTTTFDKKYNCPVRYTNTKILAAKYYYVNDGEKLVRKPF